MRIRWQVIWERNLLGRDITSWMKQILKRKDTVQEK
jgi:hypothetical protein